MTKDLNKIPIKEYLAKYGIHPKRDRQYYGMYLSPFREEKDPSLKVDFNKNLWIDFGSGEGGTMIDMVMKLDKCSFMDAIKKLDNYSSGSIFSYTDTPPEVKIKPPEGPLIRILKTKPLNNTALTKYLKERCINVDIAKMYCCEIYYKIREKNYFAIGFPNDSNGFELRNPYFKGSNSKDITTIKIGTESCSIFEGFFDFLSYLTLKEMITCNQDTVILNSIHLLNRATEFISGYKEINAYLDNDRQGNVVLQNLQATFNTVNQSGLYLPYKDLNEYLCNKEKLSLLDNRKNYQSL